MKINLIHELLIEISPYTRPTPSDLLSIGRAAERLGKFMVLPADARVRMGT